MPPVLEKHDGVIELVNDEVGDIEDALLTIDDLHGIGGEAGGAQHGQIEQGDVFAGAALLLPGILGVLGGLQFELLELGLALLAGIVGVIEGLHGYIEFLCFVEVAVAGGNQTGNGFLDGFGRLGEVIHIL